MNDNEGRRLGGIGGGLLRIFSVTGTALVAIVVGWNFSRRVKLDIRVAVGGVILGAFIGGVVGALVLAHDIIIAAFDGLLWGAIVGLTLAAIVNCLVHAASKE